MQFLRKAVFYIFLIIYLIACPLILLYAVGYIYKPGTKEGFVKTGLISVATVPSGAKIYLNKSRYTQKSPAVIPELIPGSYSLKIFLKGHKEWIRTVRVEPEKATVFDKVILLPDRLRSKEVLHGKFRDIISVPGTDFLVLARSEKIDDILAYNIKSNKAWPLLKSGMLFGGGEALSYFTEKESPYIIFCVKSPAGNKFLRVELAENKEAPAEDITKFFPTEPSRVFWHASSPKDIFSYQKGSLNRIDLDSGQVYKKYIKNVKGFGLSENALYVLANDNKLVKMDYDKKDRKILIDETTMNTFLFRGNDFYKIYPLGQEIFLFWGERGGLLTNNAPYNLEGEGIKGVSVNLQFDRAVLFKNDRVGVLDLSAEEISGEAIKPVKIKWIYKNAKNIEQVFWAHEASHVLFRDGNKVFLAGAFEDSGFSLNSIFDVADGSSIVYSDKTGEAYCLFQSPGSLFASGIVPKKDIIEMPSVDTGQDKGKKYNGV